MLTISSIGRVCRYGVPILRHLCHISTGILLAEIRCIFRLVILACALPIVDNRLLFRRYQVQGFVLSMQVMISGWRLLVVLPPMLLLLHGAHLYDLCVVAVWCAHVLTAIGRCSRHIVEHAIHRIVVCTRRSNSNSRRSEIRSQHRGGTVCCRLHLLQRCTRCQHDCQAGNQQYAEQRRHKNCIQRQYSWVVCAITSGGGNRSSAVGTRIAIGRVGCWNRCCRRCPCGSVLHGA